MPETATATQEVKLTPYELAERNEKMVTIEIPDKDLLGQPYPTISIGYHQWGPGKHQIPQSFAKTVAERMELYNHSRVDLLQDKVDLNALAKVRSSSIRNMKSIE